MSTTQTGTEFTITEAAVAQVRTIMSQQTLEADEQNLRIFVEGGGCCGGVGFGLAFDKAQPEDVKIERSGLTIVIDAQSLPYVNGATIDFVNTPEVTGFKVSAPPMAGGGCSSGGCGPESGGGGCGSGGGGCGGGSCGSGGGAEHGHDHGAAKGKSGGCCG
ncbi:MAG: iron-sulfur cluster assembly accessory protein [Planctomycetes bacterium]|nr:iron-sulfur cluster assembly accessory protein [Planctomycetota bacterium]